MQPRGAGNEMADCIETPHPAARIRTPDQATQWTLLVSSSVIMLLAAVLRSQGAANIIVPLITKPTPPACTTKRFLHIDCPGCGLTRGLVCLAHGEVARAWHYNPAGLWFFGLVAMQIPYRAWQLWRIRSGRAPLRFVFGNWPLWILLMA